MKDGKAVIPIKIKKLDDLYMKNDYLKLDLSDEVFDYIEEIAYLIPRNVDIVLEVHYHDEISNNQQQRIKKVFKSNYGSDIDDIDYCDIDDTYTFKLNGTELNILASIEFIEEEKNIFRFESDSHLIVISK